MLTPKIQLSLQTAKRPVQPIGCPSAARACAVPGRPTRGCLGWQLGVCRIDPIENYVQDRGVWMAARSHVASLLAGRSVGSMNSGLQSATSRSESATNIKSARCAISASPDGLPSKLAVTANRCWPGLSPELAACSSPQSTFSKLIEGAWMHPETPAPGGRWPWMARAALLGQVVRPGLNCTAVPRNCTPAILHHE